MDRQSKSQEEQAAMAESLKNMQKKLNEEKSIFYSQGAQKINFTACPSDKL